MYHPTVVISSGVTFKIMDYKFCLYFSGIMAISYLIENFWTVSAIIAVLCCMSYPISITIYNHESLTTSMSCRNFHKQSCQLCENKIVNFVILLAD